MPRISKSVEQGLPKNTKAVSSSSVKKPAKKAAKKKPDAEALYSEVEPRVYGPDNPITEELAKEWLGWEVLPEDSKDEFLFKDEEGNKVICRNNQHNRPYTSSLSHLYAQEILRGRWRLNGESMIIGKYGQTIACQHRLIALVLAVQKWRQDKEEFPAWETEPVLYSVVVFGVDEDDETVNTVDTGKTRSLGDAIFRSTLFGGMTSSEKKNAARTLDWAVKLLWHRTGMGSAAYAPRRTHSEAFEFIKNHPTLLRCVKHILEENEEGKISRIIAPGTAAGLMYMMAVSGDAEDYRNSESPSEQMIDLENYDKAEEFWVNIATGSKFFDPLKKALSAMIEDSAGGSIPERIALLVKAWDSFMTHGKVLEKDLKLEYHTDEDGYKLLMECPSIGGIDLGNPSEHEDTQQVTKEQIEREKEKIKAEREGKASGTGKKPAGKKKAVIYLTPNDLKKGDKVWVQDSAEDPDSKWLGVYEDQYRTAAGFIAKVRVADGYAGTGKVFDVSFESLSLVE